MSDDQSSSTDWIFESVAQILKSPAWEAEVFGFIDENCLVFSNGKKVYKKKKTFLITMLIIQVKIVGGDWMVPAQAYWISERSYFAFANATEWTRGVRRMQGALIRFEPRGHESSE